MERGNAILMRKRAKELSERDEHLEQIIKERIKQGKN